MTIYQYQGRQQDGKLKKGQIEAKGVDEANSLLKNQGVTTFQLKEVNATLYQDIYIGNPVKNKDFVIFLRQYATMIEAGIPLVESTAIIEEQTSNKVLKKSLYEIRSQLEQGSKLSEAMGVYPKIFPSLLISMIEAAELSGSLDEVLDQMATYYEKQYELKQKITTALTYPIVVGLISVVITFFLMIFIIPIFVGMFQSYGEELPALTQFVLSVSNFLVSYWWMMVLIIILMVLLYQIASKNATFTYSMDVLKLRIPIFGQFIQKALLARYTQTMSMLLASAIPVLQAVTITEKVVGNKAMQAVIRESYQAIEAGRSLAEPLEKSWIFPKFVSQMIRIGERSGELDQMLNKVAYFYDRELEEASDKLKSLIEPIMIVFLACIVGTIVLSVIIPMFSLFDQI